MVFPWSETKARWEELRYAVRSVEENFADAGCPIYVLGETPPKDYFALDDPACRVRYVKSDGYADALFKGLQLAETVLWMNDDICLLKPCGWEDFATALTLGTASRERAKSKLSNRNSWRRNHAVLVNQLYLRGFPDPQDFSTHTPYLYRRDPALEVFSIYGCFHKMAFETAYFNHTAAPCSPARGCVTSNPSHRSARFLNYSDRYLLPQFKSALMNRFPNPVPGEIAPPPPLALFDLEPYRFAWDSSGWAMDDLHIQLLFAIASLPELRSATEIGCYRGASTSALIEAVNQGHLDRLHLVEVKPDPSLGRVIAACKFPDKVTLHTSPYWEGETGPTDLVVIDGDHRWGAFPDVLRALSWLAKVVVMHDTNNYPLAMPTWGATLAASMLKTMPGRDCFEDVCRRPGMATHRGLLVSSATGEVDLSSVEKILNLKS